MFSSSFLLFETCIGGIFTFVEISISFKRFLASASGFFSAGISCFLLLTAASASAARFFAIALFSSSVESIDSSSLISASVSLSFPVNVSSCSSIEENPSPSKSKFWFDWDLSLSSFTGVYVFILSANIKESSFYK